LIIPSTKQVQQCYKFFLKHFNQLFGCKQFKACETTIFPLVKKYSAFLMFYIVNYIQNFMQTHQMIACRKQKHLETQLC